MGDQDSSDDILIKRIPRNRLETDICPDCGGDLSMGGDYGSELICDVCSSQWAIKELSWLEPVEEQ